MQLVPALPTLTPKRRRAITDAMKTPATDKERFALLAKLSTEAWLQSRAAPLMAAGNTPDEAAAKARAAFDATYAGSGLDVSYFTLTRL